MYEFFVRLEIGCKFEHGGSVCTKINGKNSALIISNGKVKIKIVEIPHYMLVKVISW